jgi:peptidoglycan glycosyltransferase
VVMEPDGRILALAGASQAEPGLSLEALVGRAWAPSASIFKVVTAAALVDAGVSADTRVCYHGGLRSVDASNLDDSEHDSACQDLAYGVSRSQNALMAKLAVRHLDRASLGEMAARLGYGQKTRFALDVERGTMDLPDLARAPVDFARAAAGFWHTMLSPIGGALLATTIASGGLAVTPQIVAEVRTADGGRIYVPARAPVRVLDARTARVVADMMVGTTRSGTAAKAFHDKKGRPLLGDLAVAGKTGSLSREEPTPISYSWFVGFAPVDSPRLIVSVALGNGKGWRFKAHTVARVMVETALARRK